MFLGANLAARLARADGRKNFRALAGAFAAALDAILSLISFDIIRLKMVSGAHPRNRNKRFASPAIGMRLMHAQGATEYLVVLSVVLIIGLVSVSLLGFFPGTAKDATSNAAAAYWQGAALPFRVVEVSQTNGSNLAFVLENA